MKLASRETPVARVFFLLFLIFFLFIFYEFFFLSRTFYARDMALLEIPSRQLCTHLLKEGNLALWTDAHGNGQPFMASPKSAVFYPTTWLYLFLPFWAAFKLHFFLHVVITWLGIYFLSRSYELGQKASFLGASLFIFSGVYLSSFEFYNHIAAMAWMPWILFLLRQAKFSSLKGLILTSSLWTLLILAGAPEFIFITLILSLAQAFLSGGEWRKRLRHSFLSLLFACFIAAVQVLPSLELLSQVDRREQNKAWPLELIQLANVIFSHFLGNDRQPGHDDFWGGHLFDRNYPLYYSLYMGCGALILAAYGLKKTKKRRGAGLGTTAFLFFLIACGRYSPFFFLYRLVPVLNSIRYPVKFIVGSFFCLSLLAAHGFEAMTEKGRAKGQTFGLNLLLIAASISIVYRVLRGKILSGLNLLFLVDQESSLRGLAHSIETGILLFNLYAVFFLLKEKARSLEKVIPLIFLFLGVIDPAFHNKYVNPTVSYSFLEKPELARILGEAKIIYRDDFLSSPSSLKAAAFQSYLYNSLYPYSGIGSGIRYILNRDFYASYPENYHRVMKLVQELPEAGKLKVLEYLGCTYGISEKPLWPSRPGLELPIKGRTLHLTPITDRKPAPYLVFQICEGETLEQRIRIFASPSFDPYHQAVIPPEAKVRLEGESSNELRGFIQPKKEAQGRASYLVDAPKKALLIIPGNYEQGWKASLDGKPVAIFEANVFSKGIFIPAGKHQVEIKYWPTSFLIGAILSLVAISIALVLLVIIFRKTFSGLGPKEKTKAINSHILFFQSFF